MRVYKKYLEFDYAYPEDMKLIIDYLKKNGEILVSMSTIENLYYDFSSEKYCASWMSVNEQMLEEFADWLNDYDF